MAANFDVVINPSGAERGGNVVKKALLDIKNAARGVQGDVIGLASALGRLPPQAQLIALALGAMGAGSLYAARSTANHIEEIKKLALNTNLSTQQAQLFASMARQTGTDLNALSGGMGKLNQNLQDAAKGSGDSQRLFGVCLSLTISSRKRTSCSQVAISQPSVRLAHWLGIKPSLCLLIPPHSAAFWKKKRNNGRT